MTMLPFGLITFFGSWYISSFFTNIEETRVILNVFLKIFSIFTVFDPYVCILVALLRMTGGSGFVTWINIIHWGVIGNIIVILGIWVFNWGHGG